MNAQTLTEIGNLGVVAPAALAGVIGLALSGATGLAWAFATETSVIFVATVVLKYLSWLSGGALLDTFLHLSQGAPSGHMAMAMAIYGGAAMICFLRGPTILRWIAPPVAAVLIVVVGVTRVLVHAHTPSDVMAAMVVAAIPLEALRRWLITSPDDRPVLIGRFIGVITIVACIAYWSGVRYSSGNAF